VLQLVQSRINDAYSDKNKSWFVFKLWKWGTTIRSSFNTYDIQLTVDACMLLEDSHLPYIFLLKILLLLLG
jgi:hypothetical protein